MRLFDEIRNYKPANEQEERDKEQMLRFMADNPDYLSRENQIAHFPHRSGRLIKSGQKH